MRRTLSQLACLVVTSLVLVACGSGDSSESSGAGAGDAGGATAEGTTYSIAPEELDGIETVDGEEISELNFAGLVDMVERGVELGEWTAAEGVIALLRAQAGEISVDDIDGLDRVTSRSGSSLLDLALQLIDDGSVDADDRAELERLLGLVMPSTEFIDAAEEHLEAEGFELPGIRSGSDSCIDAHPTLYPYVGRAPKVDCWKVMHRYVPRPGGTGEAFTAVIYPETSNELAVAALDALATTTLAAFEWSDANPSTWALINPNPMVNSKKRTVWGGAIVDGNDRCLVSLTETAFGPGDAFGQLVAHEQLHCFQFADFSDMSGKWYVEGGAEYFSHVVFPDGGLERAQIERFFARSLTEPLSALSYDSWVWWQYLANLTSPGAVWDLHRRMAAGNAVEVLAAEPGMAETFQTFTVDLRTTGFPTHGAPIPESREIVRNEKVNGSGEHSHTAERFVAVRLGVSYKAKHLFEQADDTSTDGYMQMARFPDRYDRSQWLGLPPEVRSTCEEPEQYVMAMTTVNPEPHTVEWTVEAEEYTCDPCLGGTWVLDNARFLETVLSFGALPGGMNVGIDLVGPYYVRFDGSGAGNAWRNDWKMITTGSAQGMSFTMTTTWDSIETFSYSADGERFEVWDSVTVDSRTTVDAGGLPISATATPETTTVSVFGQQQTLATQGDGPQAAGGSYTCDEQRLEIALDMAPDTPIALDRTEDIPDPPQVLPPA